MFLTHLVIGVSYSCPILVDVSSPDLGGVPHAQRGRGGVIFPPTELEEDLKGPPTADRQAGGTRSQKDANAIPRELQRKKP